MHSFDLAGTGHPHPPSMSTLDGLPRRPRRATAAACSRYRKHPHPLTTVALAHVLESPARIHRVTHHPEWP